MIRQCGPLAFYQARQLCTRPSYLTKYSASDLQRLQQKGFTFYLNASQDAGYMLSPTHDLQSVFNAGRPGQGKAIMRHALKQGARTLDCFDGYLPRYYGQFGFREYKREAWNPAFQPPGWNETRDGKPDCVYMKIS